MYILLIDMASIYRPLPAIDTILNQLMAIWNFICDLVGVRITQNDTTLH